MILIFSANFISFFFFLSAIRDIVGKYWAKNRITDNE